MQQNLYLITLIYKSFMLFNDAYKKWHGRLFYKIKHSTEGRTQNTSRGEEKYKPNRKHFFKRTYTYMLHGPDISVPQVPCIKLLGRPLSKASIWLLQSNPLEPQGPARLQPSINLPPTETYTFETFIPLNLSPLYPHISYTQIAM